MLLLILLIGAFLAAMFIAKGIPYYAEKMYFEAPPMQWLSLDDLVKMGYPRIFCQIILPSFKKSGILDIRLRENISEETAAYINEQGFMYATVPFHEYRFKPDGEGGKRKGGDRTPLGIKDWGWGEPAHA